MIVNRARGLIERLAQRYLTGCGYRVLAPIGLPLIGASYSSPSGHAWRVVEQAEGDRVIYITTGRGGLVRREVSAATWHRWVRLVQASAAK